MGAVPALQPWTELIWFVRATDVEVWFAVLLMANQRQATLELVAAITVKDVRSVKYWAA
jgi:hypothetical protein